MMLAFVVILAVSIFGMIAIPIRHLSRIRVGEEFGGESVVRVRILGFMSKLELWYKGPLRHGCLKALDRILKVFERSAGKVAGQTKSLRLIIQEHFKVIPRESVYWKQINSWKKENGNGHTKIRESLGKDDRDISNHSR
jgi:hypothetical protein